MGSNAGVEPSSKSIPLADRTDTLTDLPHLLRWPDDEDDEETDVNTQEPFEVSESTLALLKKSFTSTLPHVERHKLGRMFRVPNMEETRCPRLDSVFKTAGLSLNREEKAFEQDLARVQTFVLDLIGPFVQLLEECQSGTLEQDEAISTLCGAITLLGNASFQISKLRGKKVLKELNADIQDLADEEEIFKDAAPKLFRNGFEQTAKERAEAIKLLTGARPPQNPPVHKTFFRTNCPSYPQQGGSYQSFWGGQKPFPAFLLTRKRKLLNDPTQVKRRCQSPQTALSDIVYVGRDLPLIFHLLIIQNYCANPIVMNQLFTRGISSVAQVVAQKAHPLAGRLACFIQNWEVVTWDHRVLQIITGFQIKFLREPFQSRPPNNSSLSSNKQELIDLEVESMLSKGAIKEIHPSESQEGFYSSLFLVPKKDRGTRPVINLKRLNEFIPPQHFKTERPAKRERLAHQSGSEGCLFYNSDSRDRQKKPPLPGQGKLLPIQLPPFRSIMCPLGLYQDPKASDDYAQRARGEVRVLYRLHSGDGRLPRKDKGPHISSNLSPKEPRLYSPSRESYHNSNTRDRVPRYDDSHPLLGAPPPRSEN